MVAILDALAGLVTLGISILVGIMGATDASNRPMLVVGAAGLVLGALSLAAAAGLFRLSAWGRLLQIGLAILGLLVIPVGTVMSALLLFYLFQPGIRVLFSGRSSSDELTPDEAAAVLRLQGGSTAVVALIAAAVVLVGVLFVGIIAAIAIPSLLRARVAANEAAAIRRIREVVSAEVAYASSNGGFYGSPECLAGPERCIPSYSGPTFLTYPGAFDAPTVGYRATLHLGAPVPPEVLERGQVGAGSSGSYVVTLVPLERGSTGVRAFCGDRSGVVCFFQDGMMPPVDGEACPSECVPLR